MAAELGALLTSGSCALCCSFTCRPGGAWRESSELALDRPDSGLSPNPGVGTSPLQVLKSLQFPE